MYKMKIYKDYCANPKLGVAVYFDYRGYRKRTFLEDSVFLNDYIEAIIPVIKKEINLLIKEKNK